MFKKKLSRILPEQLIKTIINYKILSLDFGQWNSMKNSTCVDAQLNPIPWYTYPAIEYLKQFDFIDKTVFEYGSGNSSLFWAKRAKEVISVEDSKEWLDIVSERKSSNQHIVLMEDKNNYISYIIKLNKEFDIIVIDGKYRIHCARNAVKCLKDGGMIILDNSDWFPKSSALLRSHGLLEVDFSGFGPINHYTWTTSLFLSRNFNFKTLSMNQPIHSIGSIKQYRENERDN